MLKALLPVSLLDSQYYTVGHAHGKLLKSIIVATSLMSNPMGHRAD
jgi:hypothetical protein